MPQNIGLNPFAYIDSPGYEPYIPGAEQSYQNLSTLGRAEVMGVKRDMQRAAEQKAAADQLLGQIVAQHPDDPDQGVIELRRRGFIQEANAWEKHVSEMKKVKIDEAKQQLEERKFKNQVDDEAYKREQAMYDATSPIQVAKLYAGVTDPTERANVDAYVKWRWGAKGEQALQALPSSIEGVKALGMGPEAAGSQALRRDELDIRRDELEARQSGVSGQTTDFGSYYADFMAGEAEKLGKTPEELGPAWRAAQKIKARTAYGRADDAAPRITVNTGGAQTSSTTSQIPPQARAVTARIVTGMPGTQTGPITQEVARLSAEGDVERLKSYLKYAATQKVGVAQRTAIQGRIETLTALKDAEALLKQVPTGFIRGTWENTMAALGKTSDPRLREIGTRMGVILSNYMRSISGAAVSDNEAKRLTPLIPNYKNDLSVNLATLKGFANTLKSFDKAFYQETFGQDYDWVMSSATSTGGGSGFSFLLPDGRRATFPTAAAMEAAKKAMGIK